MSRYWILLVVIGAAGCRSSHVIQPRQSSPPKYSIIYIIHGDANYLYHDTDGNALQADEQVLKEAKEVAREAENGEVFIFHQLPEKKILWMFPKKDRQFLYYRNGTQVQKQRYSPQSQEQPLATEARLYHQYGQINQTDSAEKIFLYFGHEIPERNQLSYHASRPKAPLTTQNFASGMQSFLQPGESLFDLTVLSTCNNGTPSMVQAINPYTRYVLASPRNLHLSHIDTDRLAALLERPQTDTGEVARHLAENTYQRLSSFLQTVITLTLYDTRMTASYLPPLAQNYNRHLQKLSREQLLNDNRDCTTLSFFSLPDDSTGLEIWYRAPRFGQKESNDNYSGWGCKK